MRDIWLGCCEGYYAEFGLSEDFYSGDFSEIVCALDSSIDDLLGILFETIHGYLCERVPAGSTSET